MEIQFELDLNGERLVGILHKVLENTNSCIISCHGLLASKDSIKYKTLGNVLSSQNLPVVRFDFRGCGESDGRLQDSNITKRLTDLESVMDYLRKDHNYSEFGIFGSSMGGFITFIKASMDPSIMAIVSLSSPYAMNELFEAHKIDDSHFEVDGIIFGSTFVTDMNQNGSLSPELLGKVRCPVYIFQGDCDGLVPVDHAVQIYDSLKTHKEIMIIPGGDHIFSHPAHLNEIISRSSSWFKQHLNGG